MSRQLWYNASMKRDGTPAKYELIEYDGDKEQWQGKMVRRYEDGAIRDQNGRMIEAMDTPMPITRDNARQLRALRYQKYQEAAADAVHQELASISPMANTPFAAWGVLNARMAQQIMDSNIPRGFDLRILGEHMGAYQRDKELETEQNDPVGSAADLVDAIKALLDVVTERKSVIDV